MKPPAKIHREARAAFSTALELLGPERAMQHRAGLDRYARAVDLAARLRDEWHRQGRPLTGEGGATGRAVVEHPLVGMISRAERDAAFHAKELGIGPVVKRSGAGRPAGAASAPDRSAPPRLRMVGGK